MSESDGEPSESRVTLPTIHETVSNDGKRELQRSAAALGWSGLAAGMAMCFSLMAEGLLRSGLPDEPWRPLISNFGYCIGFLVVILGRQQLFTENTITVVIPLLSDRSLKTLGNVARVWGIVLASNLLGGAIVVLVLAKTNAFEPEVRAVFQHLGEAAIKPDFGTILLRGILAGWLIASLVWVLPGAASAKFWAIIVLAYLVGLGHFSHVIAGSIEVFYLAAVGAESWINVLLHYSLPALIGNVIGGVLVTAVVNHAQVIADD